MQRLEDSWPFCISHLPLCHPVLGTLRSVRAKVIFGVWTRQAQHAHGEAGGSIRIPRVSRDWFRALGFVCPFCKMEDPKNGPFPFVLLFNPKGCPQQKWAWLPILCWPQPSFCGATSTWVVVVSIKASCCQKAASRVFWHGFPRSSVHAGDGSGPRQAASAAGKQLLLGDLCDSARPRMQSSPLPLPTSPPSLGEAEDQREVHQRLLEAWLVTLTPPRPFLQTLEPPEQRR